MRFDVVKESGRKSRPRAGPLTTTQTKDKKLSRWEYDEYITSTKWKRRREQYFASHPRSCLACGGADHIELHHRTYRRLGVERDGDLAPLCQTCHAALHDYHRRHPEMEIKGASQKYITAAIKARTRWKPKRDRPHTVTPEVQDALRRHNESQRRFVPQRERMTLEQRRDQDLNHQGLPVVKVQPRRP